MTKPDQPGNPDMAARRVFSVLTSAVTAGGGDGAAAARLGKLCLPGRGAIETPNFTGVTSRGVIPHVTQDNVSKYSSFGSAYIALEDFIEKKDAPPIYEMPRVEDGDSSTLHNFTALPKNMTSMLALRRCPAVTPPSGNTAKKIPIFTSTGFGHSSVPEYAAAVEKLRPDVIIGLGDLAHTARTPTSKKQLKMVERTDQWLEEFLRLLSPETRERMALFAPVLPVEHPIQWEYLKTLSEERLGQVSGLAVYDVNLLPELAGYKFEALPKLSLDPPKNPHEVLRQICLGVDLCLTPFVNNVSDAGIALTFTFPAPAAPVNSVDTDDNTSPLGINMWDAEHNTSLAPLAEGCQCYACQKHHRAFINHLLNAKEMLGWSLLQIHNHHVLGEFFAGVRATIRGMSVADATKAATAGLEEERRRFAEVYEADIPAGTGERPRARGYHFKSEAGQEPYNKPGWQDLAKGEEEGKVMIKSEGEGEGEKKMDDEGIVNADGAVIPVVNGA